MRKEFVVGTFSDAGKLVRAAYGARAAKFRIYDAYAPYPVHGLDRAMGIRASLLPRVTAVMCGAGLVLAAMFQFYTAVLDWPLNVGGKPDNSALAFIPISFELTVLFGALATVAALFVRARLYPGKRERLFFEGVTNNVFALVLRNRGTQDAERAREFLRATGAGEIEER